MTNDTHQATVIRLLRRAAAGDGEAIDELFPLVYEELHGLARAQRRQRASSETLNTTAMRHILVDYARRARAAKRGGRRTRLSLDDIEPSLENGLTGETA